MTSSAEGTVFRYSSPELTVEISGEESFVREQIRCMGILERIASSLRGGEVVEAVEAPAAATPAPEGRPAGAASEAAGDFFRRCHARAGKGAHFDRVLLIGYWLERAQKRKAFSKADIERTYEEIGLDLPKHLDQVIGSIRRDHDLFEQAGRVGRYRLTQDGMAAARELGA